MKTGRFAVFNAVIMALIMCFNISTFAKNIDLSTVIDDTAKCVQEYVKSPTVGSIGGEWVILGLERSGAEVPESYYDGYYKNAAEVIKECKGNLSDRKYTEYSRVAIAMTAIGKNPENIEGYDITAYIKDYTRVVKQGINGGIFALIALDCGGYGAQEIRDKYIEYILDNEISGGGWTLSGDTADPDITAMALQALAPYKDRENVKAAVERGLAKLSELQCSDGGYLSWGIENCESVSQVIITLGELGIALDDARFVKNGNTLLDGLMSFYVSGKGFAHAKEDKDVNEMATEQALCALSSAQRSEKGYSSLYDIKNMRTAKPAMTAVVEPEKNAHKRIRILHMA